MQDRGKEGERREERVDASKGRKRKTGKGEEEQGKGEGKRRLNS